METSFIEQIYVGIPFIQYTLTHSLTQGHYLSGQSLIMGEAISLQWKKILTQSFLYIYLLFNGTQNGTALLKINK